MNRDFYRSAEPNRTGPANWRVKEEKVYYGELYKRGWTNVLISDLLGYPDIVYHNAYGRDCFMFDRKRVEGAEQLEEFKKKCRKKKNKKAAPVLTAPARPVYSVEEIVERSNARVIEGLRNV